MTRPVLAQGAVSNPYGYPRTRLGIAPHGPPLEVRTRVTGCPGGAVWYCAVAAVEYAPFLAVACIKASVVCSVELPVGVSPRSAFAFLASSTFAIFGVPTHPFTFVPVLACPVVLEKLTAFAAALCPHPG